MGLEYRKLGKTSTVTVKIASKIFLLFPWHGHRNVTNDLEMVVVMIDILDWETD